MQANLVPVPSVATSIARIRNIVTMKRSSGALGLGGRGTMTRWLVVRLHSMLIRRVKQRFQVQSAMAVARTTPRPRSVNGLLRREVLA